MRRSRGFTLLEVAIAMAIFGMFLVVAFSLTSDMRKWEKRLPVNFMRHPQVMSVIARMRRDVLDVQVPPPPNKRIYLKSHDGYTSGEQTLILQTILPDGLHIVVWDFTEAGVARRISYDVGDKSQWIARGLPPELDLELEAVEFPNRPYGVRLKAKDSNGQLAIDQIFQPRAHE